jgi:hypothetical protein
MTGHDTKSPDSTTDIVSANPPAARELLSQSRKDRVRPTDGPPSGGLLFGASAD